MGIDFVSLEAILTSIKHVSKKDKVLTLGRQQIHIPNMLIKHLLNKYNYPFHNCVSEKNDWCEDLFKKLGFDVIDSIDNNKYENATIIQNLNKKIVLEDEYDFIYDGGTSEHVFNIAQVLENIIENLKVGGIYCAVVPNNNQSGHGMYQFSPELYLSCFTEKYGMKILEMYIAENPSQKKDWIDVNHNKDFVSGRNTTKFDTNKEVYIIVISKKISENRSSLIQDPPNQYSYEGIDWIL